jgi:CHAD domain-containing protein
LLRDLAGNGAAEPSCLEYLDKRLNARLNQQKTRLEKKIKRIDPVRIRSRLDFLLSVMEPDEFDTGEPPEAASIIQPTLFPMRESTLSQASRILKSFTSPLSGYRVEKRFDAATDEELHSLRIASKKARYAMEIYSPIWPGGLAAHIEKARKFQDAAGAYHDWSMLHCYLDSVIKRLHSANSLRLAFEIGRVAEYAVLRQASMKPGIRAALLEFQECLTALDGQIDLWTAHPSLSARKNSPLLRAESQLRQRRAAHSFPGKKTASR